MKLMLESEVRKLLRCELGQDKYNDISDKIKEFKQVDAIPISYIESYATKQHNSNDQATLLEMIRSYRRSLNRGGDDGVHTV